MITSQKIREEWQKIQPHLDGRNGFIKLNDTQFLEPDLDELLKVLQEHHKHFTTKRKSQELSISDLMGGARPKNDCDNWALSANAWVDEYYATKDDEDLERVFGVITGLKFNGVNVNHTKCWTYSNGVWLVEPQVPEITMPTEGDWIWFVET